MSKKCCQDKHVDLLLIGEGKKKRYVFRDFNTFMYDYILNHGRKHFCCCLQGFRTANRLKYHIKDCFKIIGKQKIKIYIKNEYVKFKNYERNIKSPFMIYASFGSIPLPEDNGKQNPNELYTNQYQKHVMIINQFVLMTSSVSLISHI